LITDALGQYKQRIKMIKTFTKRIKRIKKRIHISDIVFIHVLGLKNIVFLCVPFSTWLIFMLLIK